MISSALAFLAAIAAKVVKVEPDPRDAQIEGLKTEIDYLRGQLDHLYRDRNEWRDMAERWRHRAYQSVEIAREQQRPSDEALQRDAAIQLMQQSQQANYYLAQNALMNQPAGLFDFCNCVPARQDAFRGILGGS